MEKQTSREFMSVYEYIHHAILVQYINSALQSKNNKQG